MLRVETLGCTMPGWYCWWVNVALGIFKFVPSSGGGSRVFSPLFLRTVRILKPQSAIKNEGRNKGHYME
jgi:hypothetical protein